MWQKAKVVNRKIKVHGRLAYGLEIWVLAEPPKTVVTTRDIYDTPLPKREKLSVVVNVTNPFSADHPVRAALDCLELLPEFAEQVPLLTPDDVARLVESHNV